MSKREKLIAERQQLIDEHLKQHNELVKNRIVGLRKTGREG